MTGDEITDALELLDDAVSDVPMPPYKGECPYGRALRMIATEIRRLREEAEWRPIDTESSDGDDVLIAGPFGVDKGFRLDNKETYVVDGDRVVSPTHWRPLPRGPEEE